MAGVNMVRQLSASEGSEGRQVLMRTPSAASDVTTWSANLSVPQGNPAPAYAAQIAASELVTNEIGRTVLVTHSALTLLNEFLDQVLYNILLASRSTTLGSLKAAVPMVLRPRLGKAAVKVAEEELKEYLNDDEELELHIRANAAEIKHDFDADLAWRLARLRCMVYTRLGDLEEEDEEEWLQRDGLLAQLQAAKQHSQASVETGPASAIFLTSIVEYLGEQALYYAAQHAQRRQYQTGGQQAPGGEVESSETSPNHEIVVAGKDMNHVGRDSPLARLWRSYRRNTRESSSRPMSPGDRTSYGQTFFHSRGVTSMPSDSATEEARLPDQIPLPMSTNDVNEIEVPGLASAYSDDEEETQDSSPQKRRPVSMLVMPGAFPGILGVVTSEPPEVPEKSHLRPTAGRTRSISSPVPRIVKPNVSSENLVYRDDSFIREYRKDTAGRSSAAAEQNIYAPDKEQETSLPSEKMAGGAAAVGALGVATLSALHRSDDTTETTPYSDRIDTKETAHDEVTLPRKTVAEEMLGVSPVAPPKDATTGASITNMSDFDSMHVPVALSPSPSLLQASPVTPIPNRDGDYFPTSGKNTQRVPPGEEGATLRQTDGTTDIYAANLKPAPLRTTSSQAATTKLAAVSGQRTAPKVMINDAMLNSPNTPDVDQLVSATTLSTTGSVPQSPSSAVLGTAISFAPPRGASAQVRHIKADSRGSLNSPHSSNTSAGGQLVDSTRDTSGRTPISPQSRTAGIVSGQTRATPSSSISTTRDVNPSVGVSSNSVSKRFHGKPIQIGDDSDEAKKKSLEVLIRGNETLHYTLTPAAALRDEKTRNQSPELPDTICSTNVLTQEPASHISPGGILSSSNPPKSPLRLVPQMTTPISSMGVATAALPTRFKNPLGEPRDARTEKSSSIRDLADYARSTGPLDPKQLPRPIGLPSSPKPTATSPRISQAAREPASPNDTRSNNRLKYQARDARPSRVEDTSGLLDFIREGPPSNGKEVREHRIDRRVAPFRTTMDSEDFDKLAASRRNESSLRGSEDERPTASVDPSTTSQSPLIASNGPAGKGLVSAAPPGNNVVDSDGMPQKTRRKPKDPYAIYDSEDEEDMEALRTKNQEESLIDFLRNSAPPPGMAPQPILAARPGQRSPDQSVATAAREASPHLTQSGSRIDKYRPTQPTHAPHVERRRSNQSSPVSKSDSAIKTDKPRPKARFEARDAKATRANTFELAEYLKNSGPPPNAQFQPQPFILSTNSQPPKAPTPPAKDDNTMFKRFSKQRKK